MSKSNQGQSQSERNNRSNQLNPNNDAYWRSRGEPGRPEDAADTPVPPSAPPAPKK